MSEDVAHHLGRGTGLDLPTGVRVPQNVTAQERRCQSGRCCMLGQAVTNRARTQAVVRNPV